MSGHTGVEGRSSIRCIVAKWRCARCETRDDGQSIQLHQRRRTRPHARNFKLAAEALFSIPRTVLTTACVLASAVSAAGQVPVALVEDVNGKTAGVEFMDYLPVGKIIRLGQPDSIELGYLPSCW